MNNQLPEINRSRHGEGFKSAQREYTEPVSLLASDGTLLTPGWARRMLFEYNAASVVPRRRFKEWEVSNGSLTAQVNIAQIAVGGFVSAVLINLDGKSRNAGVIVNSTVFYFGRDKLALPHSNDAPSTVEYTVNGLGRADIAIVTDETCRTLYYKSSAKGKEVLCSFCMDIPRGHESMATVLPFNESPKSFFMTAKQNCMPCSGSFNWGDDTYDFSRENTFACLDWGRVNAPRRVVWYWGNGSTYLYDESGVKHTFGFEITWGIGNESYATETCLFYDGKIHKIGAVDVEASPKPDKYMEPWHFVSEDGRFNMTMTPSFDNHSDTNALVLRMNCHQVHGRWNGTVVLDDGTRLEIKDMFAFCEYVENRW